jgi:hypothetical protein
MCAEEEPWLLGEIQKWCVWRLCGGRYLMGERRFDNGDVKQKIDSS